jgi:UvrD/REP helicase N-terminal domain
MSCCSMFPRNCGQPCSRARQYAGWPTSSARGGTVIRRCGRRRQRLRYGVQVITSRKVVGAPLLVIAGAGSGKTNTLAHRVAHLIVSGADPRRILLMTFSRRAAAEMSKRVERIARKVLGASAGIVTDALSWAGIVDVDHVDEGLQQALRNGIDPELKSSRRLRPNCSSNAGRSGSLVMNALAPSLAQLRETTCALSRPHC